MPANLATIRRIALALPEVNERLCHGTPTFFIGKKLMLRMWEDGETLVAKVPMARRAELLEADPDVFFLTDHYRTYPAVLINLLNVSEGVLRERIAVAWRCVAPAKLAAQHPPAAG
jgi:hypothetical protein